MRILFFFLTLLCSGPAFAHSFQAGDVKIGHPWGLPTAAGSTSGAVYLALMNTGAKDDQLQGAATSVAQKVTLVEDGAAVNAIDLPPARGVSLRPGAAYLKLEGLKGGLTAGDKFTLRLKFASAPATDVTVLVEDSAGH